MDGRIGSIAGVRRIHPTVVAAAALALVLLVSSCGGDDSDAAQPSTTESTAVDADAEGGDDAGDDSVVASPYAEDAWWLCRPDRDDDACDVDLSATLLTDDGLGELVNSTPSDTVDQIDCFYVYPTVNFGEGASADPIADDSAERNVAFLQAARYSEVCSVWAPLYRQLTLDGFGAENAAELREVAYGDVEAAFEQYLSERPDDQAFLLVGHSQGSGMLARLVEEVIEPSGALRERMVSAHLIGGFVTSPLDEAGDAGAIGDVELCSQIDETGCIVAFNTMGPDAGEPELARWGSAEEGRRRACVNPAGPSNGATPLRSFIQADSGSLGDLEVDTPWVLLDGLLEAECVDVGDAHVLEIRVIGGGEATEILGWLTTNVPSWGLHITEMNLTQGDLVAMAGLQIQAWLDAQG